MRPFISRNEWSAGSSAKSSARESRPCSWRTSPIRDRLSASQMRPERRSAVHCTRMRDSSSPAPNYLAMMHITRQRSRRRCANRWSISKFDSRGTALRVEMNGAAPRSRQSSGTCDKCAISKLSPKVRSAGQCIEEAFRERLLLSCLKRLRARQSGGAALGCIFERHRIFVFREANATKKVGS